MSEYRIVYTSNDKGDYSDILYSMEADGSDVEEIAESMITQYRHFTSVDCYSRQPMVIFSSNGLYQLNLDTNQLEMLVAGGLIYGVSVYDDSDLVFSSRTESINADLYTMSLAENMPTNITQSEDAEFDPDWSPDGTQIVYSLSDGDTHQIAIIDRYGGNRRVIWQGDEAARNPDWSPDGKHVVFEIHADDSTSELFVVNADGSDLINLTNGRSFDILPQWSPDGTKVSFSSFISDGRWAVYTMDANGENRLQITEPTYDGVYHFNKCWLPEQLSYSRAS